MARTLSECGNIKGKKVKVSTLYKDSDELIDLIGIGLQVKYGYKNLKAINIKYNKIGFVFSIDYEEEV